MSDAEVLWTPSPERVESARITAFQRTVRDTRGLDPPTYSDLLHWSVTDLEAFWGSIWEHFGIRASTPYTAVLGRREMPGAQWFPGATSVSYTHLRAHETDSYLVCRL